MRADLTKRLAAAERRTDAMGDSRAAAEAFAVMVAALDEAARLKTANVPDDENAALVSVRMAMRGTLP